MRGCCRVFSGAKTLTRPCVPWPIFFIFFSPLFLAELVALGSNAKGSHPNSPFSIQTPSGSTIGPSVRSRGSVRSLKARRTLSRERCSQLYFFSFQ